MTLCMNTWKNNKNYFKEYDWKRRFEIWKILALNTSQDASWIVRNAWKMIMRICNNLKKGATIIWNEEVCNVSEFSKCFGMSINWPKMSIDWLNSYVQKYQNFHYVNCHTPKIFYPLVHFIWLIPFDSSAYIYPNHPF